ncbi:MAG: hypothetical protein LOD85_01010 [Clostridia bacterium]|nr:hypothetical protein [Bacillota bacterium]MBO2521437.1 hypothetical protein [Bacillota bacterium]
MRKGPRDDRSLYPSPLPILVFLLLLLAVVGALAVVYWQRSQEAERSIPHSSSSNSHSQPLAHPALRLGNAGERASEDDRMGIASGRISEMEAHL